MADGIMSSTIAAVTSTAMDMMASATDMPADDGSFNVTTTCDGGNEYSDEDLGVRISAIFVILIGGLFGATFPVLSQRMKTNLMPPIIFFIAKYFGSGVIVATAFIHLLAPANEALGSPCLEDILPEYSWAEGIALMTVFVLFFVELIVMRSGAFNGHKFHESEGDGMNRTTSAREAFSDNIDTLTNPTFENSGRKSSVVTPQRGEDHLGHNREHLEVNAPTDGGAVAHNNDKLATLEDGHDHDVVHASYDDYAAQMTAIFILEFGIIFHSIFIGLTLAVTAPGAEFNILYVVLVFHQTFEGLGLGTRLAITPWAKDFKGRLTPYVLALGFALSTPIAIAIGLGVRTTFAPGSATALIANGVFDSISAGILLYTGLVELMAHEFMFSTTMQRANTGVMLLAFFVMCLGAGLMALLGKWA